MSLLNLFKKKEHREKYEAAEKKLKDKDINFRTAEERLKLEGYDPFFIKNTAAFLEKEDAAADYKHAKQKLDKLYASGQKDALKLNENYDALVHDVQKAYRDWKNEGSPTKGHLKERGMKANDKLYNFEKEELGMHGENERYFAKHRKNIGTIVGVFAVTSLVISSLNAVTVTGNVVGSSGAMSPGSVFLLIGIVLGAVWFFLRER